MQTITSAMREQSTWAFRNAPVQELNDNVFAAEISGDAIATLRAAHYIRESPERYMRHRIVERLTETETR